MCERPTGVQLDRDEAGEERHSQGHYIQSAVGRQRQLSVVRGSWPVGSWLVARGVAGHSELQHEPVGHNLDAGIAVQRDQRSIDRLEALSPRFP